MEVTVTAVDTGTVREVPLDKLKPSPENVRRTDSEAEIETLATSIDTHGLLQMPVVAPEFDAEGTETGYYLVTAGERRRKALWLLVTRKRLKKTALIPCRMKVDGNPTELSLVENAMRRDMHPADQFEAFAKLHDSEGFGLEEIAARFGVTATVIKQRLKLAAVSPKLMAGYRNGELTLDQLMAFAITDDHARQEEVWGSLGWNKGPDIIRRVLTQGQVSSRDRRVTFVGTDAFEAAGGVILRDLFADDFGGWLTDSVLLERLLREKLEAAAEEVRQEGWKWVEVHPEYPHGALSVLRRIYPAPVDLPAEEQAELDSLSARYDELAGEGDDVPDEIAAELETIDERMSALQQRAHAYQPEAVSRAGAVVSLSSEGTLRIERGFVKREDDEPSRPTPADRGHESSPEVQVEPTGLRPLPDTLIADLTAHRTAALRECLAARTDVALVALTHVLALAVFFHGNRFDPGSCLGVELTLTGLDTTAPGIGDSKAGQAMTRRHEEWARSLPDANGLWDWIVGQSKAARLSLLAYCVARTVNAVRQPNSRPRALAHGDRLAEAVALDMTAWWHPTRGSYLKRASKARILEAVREGVSERDADTIAGLKKEALVEHAERLLAGKGWLPEVLRSPTPPLPEPAADETKAAE